MVDLHRTEPGLPPSHPWVALSRWRIALRVVLACALVGGLGVLLFSLSLLGSAPRPHETMYSLGLVFGVVAPLLIGLVGLLLGAWLRRFYPFSQGLLFGGIGAAAIGMLVLLLSVIDSLRRSCPPNALCAGPLDGLAGFGLLYAFPLFLQGCIGYQLAIWSVTRRGSRVFWPLLAVVLAVFITLATLSATGVLDPAPQDEEPPESVCGEFDGHGGRIVGSCSGFDGSRSGFGGG